MPIARLIKHLAVLGCMLAASPWSSASAEEKLCNKRVFTLSGKVSSADAIEGEVVKSPTRVLGFKDDSLLALDVQLRRTSDYVWLVDLLDRSEADVRDGHFTSFGLVRVDFSPEGLQLLDQQVGVRAIPSQTGYGELVDIRISGLSVHAGAPNVEIVSTEQTVEPCFGLASLEEPRAPATVTYYDKAELLEAMLADKPPSEPSSSTDSPGASSDGN